MDATRLALLRELERFAADNDRRVTERREKMLNITPDTGALLALLVKVMKARRILEVGTSNGYSTLWLADAAEALGGRVTTLEIQPAKADLARQNFDRAGLTPLIDLRLGDADSALPQLPAAAFDLVFLDTDRNRYVGWWPEVNRVLAPGGLLVVDNAVTHPQEMADFCRLVTDTPGYTVVLVPIGNGEFLALKDEAPR